MLLNFPPLTPGMLFTSWLDLFAQANNYESFYEFRRHYNPAVGGKSRKLSLAKNALFPRLYGVDRAIDDVLDLFFENHDINICDVIRRNTLFSVLYSHFAPQMQAQFDAIVKPSFPIDKDIVMGAYKAFRSFNGLDYIVAANNGFLFKANIDGEAEIRYCPECVKEDTEKYGNPPGWIWHNFPYVCVCPKHGTDLVTYPNGHPGVNEECCVANPHHGSANIEYARFVSDFLQHIYDEDRLYNLTSFTLPIYRFQKKAQLSAWRLLAGVLYGGYIDSTFDYLDVRSPSDAFSDLYYEDETLNYAMYEPQNMFSVLTHTYGSFSYFLPALTAEDHMPTQEAVNAFRKRTRSSLSEEDLRQMDFASLKQVIDEKTSGNCTLTRINEGRCFMKVKEIPACEQFRQLIKNGRLEKVVSASMDEIVGDLAQRHSYMFIPGFLEFYPADARAKEYELFSNRCDALVNAIASGDIPRMPIRDILFRLACPSFGLLSRKECSDMVVQAINQHPDLQNCENSRGTTIRRHRTVKEAIGA